MNPLPSWLDGRAHSEAWYNEEEASRVVEHAMRPRWETLVGLIRERGCRRVCEVGVDQGLNAEHILSACWRELDCMVLVDKCKYAEFDRRVLHEPWPAVYLEMLSTEAAAMYPPDYFDLVFIDAWHDYRDVREDIDAWLPTVADSGVLAGHDWNLPETGVREAVLETMELGVIHIAEDPASGGRKWVWWADVGPIYL